MHLKGKMHCLAVGLIPLYKHGSNDGPLLLFSQICVVILAVILVMSISQS